MVWRSLFKMTTMILQYYTNYKTFVITNNLISALSKSITSKNNDLCIDALNTICAVRSQLSKSKSIIILYFKFVIKLKSDYYRVLNIIITCLC